MANYFENERVFLPKGASWLSDYESSLVTFPNGAHDEDVDCTSMAQNTETKKSMLDLFETSGCNNRNNLTHGHSYPYYNNYLAGLYRR